MTPPARVGPTRSIGWPGGASRDGPRRAERLAQPVQRACRVRAGTKVGQHGQVTNRRVGDPVRVGIETPRGVVDVPGPGAKVRFGVGRVGCRGSVWKVWAGRSTSDVYIVNRQFGAQKISLHQLGDWRVQWRDAATAEQHTQSPERIRDRWKRPPEFGVGWTRALSIATPAEDIIDVPGDDQARKDIIWLAPPQAGLVCRVTLVVARPDQGEVRLMDSVPFAAFHLVDGQTVLLFVSYAPADPAVAAWRQSQRDQVYAVGDMISRTRRVLVFVPDPATGARNIHDLAAHPSQTP
jgi:hypothetical protein